MQEENHGSIYEIPLVEAIDGYAYVRILYNHVMYKKPLDYFGMRTKLVQFLNLKSEKPLDTVDDANLANMDLFCDPFHFHGKIPNKGARKWKKIAVINQIDKIDYVPCFNHYLNIRKIEVCSKEEFHRVEIDLLGTDESDKFFSPSQVMHLPTTRALNHETIVYLANYFWALELEISNDKLQSDLGNDVNGINIFGGKSWELAKYYHPLFKTVPIEFRGRPFLK